jgi:hypothetical protein
MKWLCAFLLTLSPGLVQAAPDILWIGQVEGRASGSVDKSLVPYRELFEKQFHLSGLTLLDTEKEPLEPGDSSVATFKGGYTMKVTSLERQPTRYVVSLALADKTGPILETKVEIARDCPIILAGPETPEGRQLFLIDVR